MKLIRCLTCICLVVFGSGCSLNEAKLTTHISQNQTPCFLNGTYSCHVNLPATKAEIVRITQPPGVDMPVGLVEKQEQIRIFYNHGNKFDGELSEIRYVALDIEAQGYSTPKFFKILPGSTNKIRDGGSVIHRNGKDYLYYIEADTWFGKPGQTYRAVLDEGQLTQITPLHLQRDVRVNGWPKWYLLASGDTAMTFRAGRSELFLAVSEDGLHFDKPIPMQTSGAMPALGEFANNTLIYTYQKGRNYKIMQSYFQLSKDNGQTWSEREKIAPDEGNVHDTTTITRGDGNIDAYYIYPPLESSQSFSLFRRCIDVHGNLGPAEQVIETRFGNVAKPKVNRLANGHVLVMFTEQGLDVPAGDHSVYVVELAKDARCLVSD